MPIYEFQCSSCDHVTESIVTMNTEHIECEVCGGESYRIMSQNSFRLKGIAWASNGYSSIPKENCSITSKVPIIKDRNTGNVLNM